MTRIETSSTGTLVPDDGAGTKQAKAGVSAQLKYVGVKPSAGRRDYEFVMRDPEDRHFTLSVRDADFASHQLSFQEAPDLCYQKLQAQLAGSIEIPNNVPIWVTADDLAIYREGHKRVTRIRGRWTRPL